jgi:hypothetical protein
MTASRYRGAYTGRMNEPDPALQWFLDDAKRQGLSVREYEAKYRILLLPARHAIASHESALTEALGLHAGSVPSDGDGGSTVGDLRAVLDLSDNLFARAAGLAVLAGLADNETAPEEIIDDLLEAVMVAQAA